MNPSALGWIKKFTTTLPESSFLNLDRDSFYTQLKSTGFIYGTNVNTLLKFDGKLEYNEEERCKINLVSSFYYIYKTENSSLNFITSVNDYYKSIDKYKRSFLLDVFGEPKPDRLLEKIIHKRIHIDDNIITKSFNHFLINVFLFIDVIGYHHFIQQRKDTKTYINHFESAIESIVFNVLESKTIKTEYDHNLIKLFEASLQHKSHTDINVSNIAKTISGSLEKHYIIDSVCMASWSDKQIDAFEYDYLHQLCRDLSLDERVLKTSISYVNQFYKTHKDQIAFLSSKNLAQSFYDNSSKVVTRLIKRNSKRLIKELSQSKEALALLAKSTHTNLTDEEQKKIQSQLLDIFKSIPSLAIFMLPGGMILLPLFIKFIPKLLPSAFDDNRIETKDND